MKKRNKVKNKVKWFSSRIERLYRLEKIKIEHSAQRLEHEKLEAYLRLLDKQKHSLKSRINLQTRQIHHHNSQLRLHQKKGEHLLQKIKKVESENQSDLQNLGDLVSKYKRLRSELRNLDHKR